MKRRILFLMSDTGGGHRAAAGAIADAIEHLYPDHYETLIVDIWRKHTPWPVNRIPDAYPWLTGSGLWVWRLLWLLSVHFKAHKLVFPLVLRWVRPRVVGYLASVRPDIVVSVHPLMNHMALKLVEEANLDIPFVTVVTDMVTVNPVWICPEVTRCLVSTANAAEAAIKLRMPPDKVRICGQPVDLKFMRLRNDKLDCRRRLGLEVRRPTVMILGGGEGFGRVFDIARELARSAPDIQLIVVAGRNQQLKEKLERINWEVPVLIQGFVDNIPELMQAADILITKAGPNTISEALILGLPLIIFGYIPGQEQGNLAYVQNYQVGVYAETPQKISHLVREWSCADNPILEKMSRNAAALARPQAALMIAGELCRLVSKLESVSDRPRKLRSVSFSPKDFKK